MIAALISAAALSAQEAPPDSSEQVPYSRDDSTRVMPPSLPGDTTFFAPDTVYSDTTFQAVPADTLPPETSLSPGDTTQSSIYDERTYIARGVDAEVRHIPFFFVLSPGPIGSPAIPVPYLNVAGADVTINGMPFLYQGLFRPYMVGADVNTIPWEILNDISPTPGNGSPTGLDFKIGRPPGLNNRSDIEITRGPYGYTSSRWRFFRPFGRKTYAYFTVGFKKSDGFIENSDYNGFHVTGGLARKIGPGELSLDYWSHKAKAGLNSFDFAVSQLLRQSRGIDRGEVRYETPIRQPFFLGLTGLYQRSAQTIGGYVAPVKTKLDIAGGKITISDSLSNATLTAGAEYYHLNLYGIANRQPKEDIVNTRIGVDGGAGNFGYLADIAFAWNSLDYGELLPTLKVSYSLAPEFTPFAYASRSRQYPDLYLRYFSDSVPGLGVQGFLRSYAFMSNPGLLTPEVSLAALGAESDFGAIKSSVGVAYNRVHSQVTIAYAADSVHNVTLTPQNFDDQYLSIFATAAADLGSFTGEFSGVFRRWNDKYFDDGLEKGPAAMAYVRLSYRRQIFVPKLYLGGSIESRLSSRRDYRAFAPGFTDAFAAVFGRLEFQYKDFSFWLGEDNISNTNYITWWPYYEAPRNIWWGLRWRFFD